MPEIPNAMHIVPFYNAIKSTTLPQNLSGMPSQKQSIHDVLESKEVSVDFNQELQALLDTSQGKFFKDVMLENVSGLLVSMSALTSFFFFPSNILDIPFSPSYSFPHFVCMLDAVYRFLSFFSHFSHPPSLPLATTSLFPVSMI